MLESDTGQDISDIATMWTVVRDAHGLTGGDAAKVSRAQQVLMERYSGSVYRYLRGALHDQHAADDLFGEFTLRFLQGAFRNANPEKGRFRDFVKTALYHLICDYQNKAKRAPHQLLEDSSGGGPAAPDLCYDEEEFVESWRNDVLSRAWQALETESKTRGHNHYRVLRLRAQCPELSSRQIADRLTAETGEPVTDDGIRQTMKRAREKFSMLVLDDLARSLSEPTRETLEQELIDLQLHSYCKKYLDQWRP
jgi:RNA polymerase sigma-70 factor (ECF subfamily)